MGGAMYQNFTDIDNIKGDDQDEVNDSFGPKKGAQKVENEPRYEERLKR